MGGYSENCDCVDCRKVRGEPLEDVATPIMTLTPSKIAELRTQLDRVSMLTAGMYGTIPSPLSVSDTRRLLDALEAAEHRIDSFESDRPAHEAKRARIRQLEDALRDERARADRLTEMLAEAIDVLDNDSPSTAKALRAVLAQETKE